MTMRCLLALVAVGCGVMTTPLAAHPVLTFTIASHKESPKGLKSSGQAAPNSDERFPLTVTLDHRYLIVEAPGARTIYDFERQRILGLNLATKSYTDISLYVLPAFRDLEFQSRLMLGSALSAGKTGNINSNAMQAAFAEQTFSILDRKQDTRIDQRQSSDETEFLWQENKLLSISHKTRDLPPGYQSEYWRFLRYYAGGHPKIYSALASVQGVPETITFVLQNEPRTETRKISLNAIRTEADGPYSLEGFSAVTPSEEPYNTLKLLGTDAAAQLARRADATKKDRDAALVQGHVLDAVLANSALLLITGDSAGATAWTAQHSETIQSDESARSYMATLNPRDQASAQAALQALSDLRKQAGTEGYVLDVAQGGADHLLAALAINPYLLGAWGDLGWVYYKGWQFDKAWACWDAARKINPQYPRLLQITQMESQARTYTPDYFIAAAGEPQGNPVPAAGAEEAAPVSEAEMIYFYRNPSPQRIAQFMVYFNKLVRPDNPNAQPPIIGFLAAAFQRYPNDLDRMIPEGLTPIMQGIVATSLQLAGQEKRAQQAVARLKESGHGAPDLTRLPSSLDAVTATGPNEFDVLWGASFATGDPRYCLKILASYAAVANAEGTVEDIVTLARTLHSDTDKHWVVERWGADKARELIVQAVALWALNSNAQQHEFVHAAVANYIGAHPNEPASKGLLAAAQRTSY